ncbi:hypothetical protein JCM14076_23700 [Methylosoma difficile]
MIPNVSTYWNQHKALWYFFVTFYVSAGLCAGTASCILQYEIIKQLVNNSLIPWVATYCLEVSKICTIVVFDYLRLKKGVELGWNRILIRVFQLSLISMSFTCSLVVLSDAFDRPELEKVIAADIDARTQQYNAQSA